MKHNTYWEIEEQVRDTLIKEKSLSDNDEDKTTTKYDKKKLSRIIKAL